MKKFSLAMLALAPVLAAAPAFAAEPATQATTSTTTTTTATKTMAAPAAAGRMQMDAEHRLADLKGKLKITADQEKQWDDFSSTMKENAASTDALIAKHKEAGDVTALESMQGYAEFTQHNADNVQRLLPKFEALYNALTPAQKKTADETFAKARERMMKHGRAD